MIQRAFTLCLLFIFLIPNHIEKQASLPPHLLKDINTRTSDLSKLSGLMEYQGMVFYFSGLPENPAALWKSDGTPENTQVVKSGIYYGCSDKVPTNSRYAVFQSTLYFCAYDPAYGEELWRTDGTTDGTLRVADLAPGAPGSSPTGFVQTGEWLYFVAANQLWKTNGSSVERLTPSDIYVNHWPPQIFNGLLYFGAYRQMEGNELWRTDGTQAGTQRFVDIEPGQGSSSANPIFSYNGWLYFYATDGPVDKGGHGLELWATNGTVEKTFLYSDLNPAGDSFPGQIMEYANGFIVTAADDIHGRELWWTPGVTQEGNPSSLTLIQDLFPGPSSSDPALIGMLGNRFLFYAKESAGVYSLWGLSNASIEPLRITEVRPYLQYRSYTFLEPVFVKFQDRIYFPGYEQSHGWELWETGGTTQNTRMMVDIWPGPWDSNPNEIVLCGTRMCFPADNGEHGLELWSSDGTANGSALVFDLNTSAPGSGSRNLTAAGDLVYFTADDGIHWPELWRTDGTSEGTFLVKDINPDGQGANPPVQLTPAGSWLFFSTYTGLSGSELWATDGRPDSAWQVADLYPGSGSAHPRQLTPVGSRLYFIAQTAPEASRVWSVENGTTVKSVLDLPNDKVADLTRMAALGDQLWMMVYDLDASPIRVNILRTGGSVDGIETVFSELSNHGELLPVNGSMFFSGQDTTGLPGIWRADGRIANITRISLPAGTNVSGIRHLTNVNGHVFFFASNVQTMDLYHINRTNNTAELVKQFPKSAWIPTPYGKPLAYAGRLVFRMQQPDYTMVLFISDGTETGTKPIPGAPGFVDWLTPAGPFLFFTGEKTALPTASGNELLVWDGTANEPRVVADINPGPAASNPHSLAVLQDKLYFSADDGSHGNELWIYDIPIKRLFMPVIKR